MYVQSASKGRIVVVLRLYHQDSEIARNPLLGNLLACEGVRCIEIHCRSVLSPFTVPKLELMGCCVSFHTGVYLLGTSG